MKCDYGLVTEWGQTQAVQCSDEAILFFRTIYFGGRFSSTDSNQIRFHARCEAHGNNWFTAGSEITREEYLVAQVMES